MSNDKQKIIALFSELYRAVDALMNTPHGVTYASANFTIGGHGEFSVDRDILKHGSEDDPTLVYVFQCDYLCDTYYDVLKGTEPDDISSEEVTRLRLDNHSFTAAAFMNWLDLFVHQVRAGLMADAPSFVNPIEKEVVIKEVETALLSLRSPRYLASVTEIEY